MTANVKNRFEQAGSGSDNDLIIGGLIKGLQDSIAESKGDPALNEIDYSIRINALFEKIFNPSTLQLSIKSDDYLVLLTDDVIASDTTDGSITLTLPATDIPLGKKFSFPKISNFGQVTIDGNGNNIVGSSTLIVSNKYDSPTIIWNSLEWIYI